MKTTIVVPTIREDCIKNFLNAWRFKEQVIVVEDNPTKTFDLKGVDHYSWKEIDKDLGDKSWVVSRRDSAIRIYGFLKAVQDGADIIISLDDDCYPVNGWWIGSESFIEKYKECLLKKVSISWVSTTKSFYPRGFPYRVREEAQVMLHMGLWTNVPDLDGITQLKTPITNYTPEFRWEVVPKGAYFPLCGMNFGFRAEIAPEVYFPLMGLNQPYSRFDDIWCGIFLKRFLDKNKYAATFGEPYIKHIRASDVYANIKKEEPGIPINEYLFETDFNTPYFKKVKRAQYIWRSLFRRKP